MMNRRNGRERSSLLIESTFVLLVGVFLLQEAKGDNLNITSIPKYIPLIEKLRREVRIGHEDRNHELPDHEPNPGFSTLEIVSVRESVDDVTQDDRINRTVCRKNIRMLIFDKVFQNSITNFEKISSRSKNHKMRHKRHKLRLSERLKVQYDNFINKDALSPNSLELHFNRDEATEDYSSAYSVSNELFLKTSQVVGNLTNNKIITDSDYVNSSFPLKAVVQKSLKDQRKVRNQTRNNGSFTMPAIPLKKPLLLGHGKVILKSAIQSKFLGERGTKTRGRDTKSHAIIPVLMEKNEKSFMEIERERSYREELLNRVGTGISGRLPMNRNLDYIELPIPNMRAKTFRDKIFTKRRSFDEDLIRNETFFDPLSEMTPNDMNLLLFGSISEGLAKKIRSCGSYMSVNLLKPYNLDELITVGNQKRSFIIYINAMRVNADTWDIAFERMRQIVDETLRLFQGLSIFNMYPYEDQLLNQTKGISQTEEERLLLDMNDALLDYCAQEYPRCLVKNNLRSLIWALHKTYTNFESYNADIFERQFCSSKDICSVDKIESEAPPRIVGTPLSIVKEYSSILCTFPYHRILEFILNVPVDLNNVYKEQKEIYLSRLDTLSKRVSAQTGLVLQDILPLDLKKYDKNRPPKYEGQATVVYFHVTVLSVDSINEESMTYVADIFLAQSWRDHRLRLPENMTEEYRILDVEWLHNIWRPDCFFKNAKQVTFHEMSVPNHYLWLYHDKTLLYMAKLTLVLSCAMKFETYPHDTQICSMMIESLSHTTHDLVFKWNETDPLVVNPDIELPQLDISRNNTEDCTLTYSTGNFTCLAVVFNLRRRLGYHLFHTYIPSAITVVMSWISFWIKPEAIPARVTLGVTSLLTLATQNQQSQSSLPPVSYIKAIDVWMSSCTVFVFASLLEFGLVNHFMNSEPIGKDMTGYSIEDLTEYDENKLAEEEMNGFRRSRSRSRSQIRSHSPRQPQYVVTRCSGKDVAVYIDKFSRFFFPFSFCVLNISYWTNYGSL